MKISEAAGLQVVHKRDDDTWARLDRKADKRVKGPNGESLIVAEGKPYATLSNAVTILENDPYWAGSALRYNQFIGPLIKAVQELTARIEQLEGGD